MVTSQCVGLSLPGAFSTLLKLLAQPEDRGKKVQVPLPFLVKLPLQVHCAFPTVTLHGRLRVAWPVTYITGAVTRSSASSSGFCCCHVLSPFPFLFYHVTVSSEVSITHMVHGFVLPLSACNILVQHTLVISDLSFVAVPVAGLGSISQRPLIRLECMMVPLSTSCR